MQAVPSRLNLRMFPTNVSSAGRTPSLLSLPIPLGLFSRTGIPDTAKPGCCFRLGMDLGSRDWKSCRNSSRPTTTSVRRASASSSADAYCDLKLETLESSPKTSGCLLALLLLQVMSAILAAYLWFVIMLMNTMSGLFLKGYVSHASEVAFFTLMLLLVSSAICISQLAKLKELTRRLRTR